MPRKIESAILIIFLISCTRTSFSVLYDTCCGTPSGDIYVVRKEKTSIQEYNVFGGYYESNYSRSPATRTSLMRMDTIGGKEEVAIVYPQEILWSRLEDLNISSNKEFYSFSYRETLYLLSFQDTSCHAIVDSATNPFFFPDGESLLFERGTGIYVYRIRDGTSSEFLDSASFPSIDSAGKYLCFMRDTFSIVMDLETGVEVFKDTSIHYPRISPDGSKVIGLRFSGELAIFDRTTGNLITQINLIGASALCPSRPSFVGNDMVVYRGYSAGSILKAIYLLNLNNKHTHILAKEFVTFN
ncbi:hypothetical protein DRQ23_04810 [bacterium]|nr:MAG: hypothetical protein DRQ23_04810 [bacterium]